MSPIVDEQIEEQALSWLMRMNSGTFTAEQHQQWRQWLAQDSLHGEAYRQAEQLWTGLEALRGSPVVQVSLQTAIVPESINEVVESKHILLANCPRRRDRWLLQSRLSAVRRLGLAACLALTVLSLPQLSDSIDHWRADYQTGIGRQQTIQLADGSSVFLNADSALNAKLGANLRGIELLQGEAEFQVSKDAQRPFVVTVDGQQIKALGTDFLVKKTTQGLRVSVLESAVQITSPAQRELAALVLHAGEQVDIASGQAPGPVTTINPHHAAAWRQQRLIFEAEPLAQVVAEINRNRLGHVFLSRPELANLRVSGVFNIADIDALLAVIGKTLPVKSLTVAGRYAVLY